MKITWNRQEARFEAVLTAGAMWSGDKDALSLANFSCTGPPLWIWFATKAIIISSLRENRPQSGLTITPEALERYTALQALEAVNTAVKAQLDLAKKALRKEQKYQTETAAPTEEETEHGRDFDYIKTVMSKSCPYIPPIVPPPPTTLCQICQTPVYFYERQEPPTCLWCEFPGQISENKT